MKIRDYKDSDLPYLKKICQDTAIINFHKSKRKRELVYLMYLDYYLKYEKENALVLADDNDVARGYIVCSLNSKLYETKMKKEYRKEIFKRSLIVGIFSLFQDHKNFKLNEKYSGGFHINIEHDYQGKGYGTKLLDALQKKVIASGNKYMFLVTKDENTRGYPFYKHYRFKEKEKRLFGTITLVYDLDK
jgi:ribosomal protein S18 acetylase RimI-like enzyme